MRLNSLVINSAADYKRCLNADVWQQAAAEICARHKISYTTLRRSLQGENILFRTYARDILTEGDFSC